MAFLAAAAPELMEMGAMAGGAEMMGGSSLMGEMPAFSSASSVFNSFDDLVSPNGIINGMGSPGFSRGDWARGNTESSFLNLGSDMPDVQGLSKFKSSPSGGQGSSFDLSSLKEYLPSKNTIAAVADYILPDANTRWKYDERQQERDFKQGKVFDFEKEKYHNQLLSHGYRRVNNDPNKRDYEPDEGRVHYEFSSPTPSGRANPRWAQ